MNTKRRLVAAALALTAVLGAACTPPPGGGEPGGPSGDPTVIAAVGDFGYDHPYIQTLGDMVGDWEPDYVVTTGDNVQTPLPVDGTDRYDLVVGRHFCSFMANVAPGPHCPSGGDSTSNRFFPATGNHDHTEGPIQNYLDYFDLPGPGTTSTSPTGSELYYDVVLGPVHVFVLDSEPMYQERNLPADQRVQTNQQRDWLQQAALASDAPWKVVTMHDPPFSSGADYGSAAFVQWPYADWDVDMVMASHAALYERVHRDGVVYVTNGLGGGEPRPFGPAIPGSVVRFNEDVATANRLTATATGLRLEVLTVEGDRIDLYDFP